MLDDPALLEHVDEMGALLTEGLRELPRVQSVRGRGLMVAAEVDADAPADRPPRAARGAGARHQRHRPEHAALPPAARGEEAEIAEALRRVGELLA